MSIDLESLAATLAFVPPQSPPIVQNDAVLELIERVREAERWGFVIDERLGHLTEAPIVRDGIPVFIGHSGCLDDHALTSALDRAEAAESRVAHLEAELHDWRFKWGGLVAGIKALADEWEADGSSDMWDQRQFCAEPLRALLNGTDKDGA